MAVNVSAFHVRIFTRIGTIAHNSGPEESCEVVGSGVKGAVLEEAVVAGCEGVMEDNAVGKSTEAAELVEGSQNVKIGGRPGISAAARVTRLGNPHLSAGNVLVSGFEVVVADAGSNSEVSIGVSRLCGPVTVRNHRSYSLGDAVVVVVGIYVHRNLSAAHKVVNGTELHHITKACAHRILIILLGHTGVAGAYDKALGIVLAYPRVCYILIADVVGKIVANRRAGHLEHIRLVHKLECVDLSAELIGHGKELLDLSEIKRTAILVVARAVTCGNEELAIYRLNKVKDICPLLAGKNALVSLGSLAAGGVVEIVVGLGCPSAGNTYPNGAEFLCKRDELLVCCIDRGIVLHKACHCGVVGEALELRELLSACDLSLGVCLPEGAAGNLGHLYVVGHKTGVDVADLCKARVCELKIMCHNILL